MLENEGEEVSILPVVYHRAAVSVSSLGYFSSVGSSYKPYRPSFTLSLSENSKFKSISRKRVGGNEN